MRSAISSLPLLCAAATLVVSAASGTANEPEEEQHRRKLDVADCIHTTTTTVIIPGTEAGGLVGPIMAFQDGYKSCTADWNCVLGPTYAPDAEASCLEGGGTMIYEDIILCQPILDIMALETGGILPTITNVPICLALTCPDDTTYAEIMTEMNLCVAF